jgi:hypothetical protein
MRTCLNRNIGFAIWVLIAAVFLAFACSLAGCDGSSGGGKDDDDGPFMGGEGTGADGITTFWRYFGEYATNDWGTNYAVDVADDGGFLVAGERWLRPDLGGDFSAVDARDFIIFKTDAKGIIEWRTTEHKPEVEEILYDVKQTADGGAIAVGTSREGDVLYALAVKVDSEGKVEWKKTFDGGGTHYNEARAVCVHENEYVIAGGTHSEVGVREFYFWFFKIDLNGNKIDGSERLPVLRAAARAMDKIDGGGFVLAGVARYAFGGPTPHLHVARLDENGDLLWNRYYGTGFADAVRSVGKNGFIVVGGTSEHPDTSPDRKNAYGRVMRIDADGDVIWDRVLGGSDGDAFHGVGITASGNFVAAGITRSYTDSSWPNIFLAKLDKDGTPNWQKAKGKRGSNEDAGHAIAMTPDGGFVVAGRGPNTFVKFDRNGDTITLDDIDFSYTVVEDEGLINMINAADIAMAAADSVIIPFRVGAMPTDLLIDTLDGMTVPEWCNRGGSFLWQPLPQAVPDLNGQSFLLTFSSCESGSAMDPIILHGRLSITVESVSGDIVTDNCEAQTLIYPINISVTDDMGKTDYSGGLAYHRKSEAGSFTEQVIIDQYPLIVSDESTLTIHQLDLSASRTVGGALNIGAAGEQGRIEIGLITGHLTIRIEMPVSVDAMDVPTAGKLKVLAQDDSRLFMTFDNGYVDIEVDTNGNGEIDDTMRIEWD